MNQPKRKVGRPNLGKARRIVFTVRLEPDLLKQARREAKRQGKTVARYLEDLARNDLDADPFGRR